MSRKSQGLYRGRTGERFVTAPLLRRGVYCTPRPVAPGVDRLAHRTLKLALPLHQAQHELEQFQVKTTTTNEYRASMQVRKVHRVRPGGGRRPTRRRASAWPTETAADSSAAQPTCPEPRPTAPAGAYGSVRCRTLGNSRAPGAFPAGHPAVRGARASGRWRRRAWADPRGRWWTVRRGRKRRKRLSEVRADGPELRGGTAG